MSRLSRTDDDTDLLILEVAEAADRGVGGDNRKNTAHSVGLCEAQRKKGAH
jgi:hypothetical protein